MSTRATVIIEIDNTKYSWYVVQNAFMYKKNIINFIKKNKNKTKEQFIKKLDKLDDAFNKYRLIGVADSMRLFVLNNSNKDQYLKNIINDTWDYFQKSLNSIVWLLDSDAEKIAKREWLNILAYSNTLPQWLENNDYEYNYIYPNDFLKVKEYWNDEEIIYFNNDNIKKD